MTPAERNAALEEAALVAARLEVALVAMDRLQRALRRALKEQEPTT